MKIEDFIKEYDEYRDSDNADKAAELIHSIVYTNYAPYLSKENVMRVAVDYATIEDSGVYHVDRNRLNVYYSVALLQLYTDLEFDTKVEHGTQELGNVFAIYDTINSRHIPLLIETVIETADEYEIEELHNIRDEFISIVENKNTLLYQIGAILQNIAKGITELPQFEDVIAQVTNEKGNTTDVPAGSVENVNDNKVE